MNIICNFLFVIVLTLVIVKEYTLIQTYHYEISKYFFHIKVNSKKYYYFLYFLLGVFLIKFEVLYALLATLFIYYLKGKYDLKLTKRVKRLMIVNITILSVLFLTNSIKYVFIVPFLYLLLLHYISLLIEKIIFIKYLKKAKKKIKNKFVIGITGSCGKTSVKNIVYDLLINKLNIEKSPKSYNTRVGITKSINDYVGKYDEYFVCEYGIDRVKGMDKLLKIVKPNIAIITEIGNQHLLSFKSVENILKEKIKLIESLDEKGIGIINNDNKYLREYDYKNKNILRYGIENKSDVMAKNIQLHESYSQFDLYIKDKYITRLTIKLLSIHGIENTLAGITCCLALDLAIEDIVNNVKNIQLVEHRLEPKHIDGIETIDDSYNSNIKGFKEALEILNMSKKYKIIITPGIIEQGKNNKNINQKLAKIIIEKVDYVYLVSENSKHMSEYFESVNYSSYKICNSFIEAFNNVKKIDKEKIVLIENDLPSIYLN